MGKKSHHILPIKATTSQGVHAKSWVPGRDRQTAGMMRTLWSRILFGLRLFCFIGRRELEADTPT